VPGFDPSRLSAPRTRRGGMEDKPKPLNLVESAAAAFDKRAAAARDAAANANADVAPARAEPTKFIAGHGFITYSAANALGKGAEWNDRIAGGRRTRRRHRTRKSRRRGGYDETKTRRRHIAKLMLEEASRRRRAAKNQAEMARLIAARRRYAEGRKA